MAAEVMMGLVSTEWLAAHLGDPSVRICDVRWYLPVTGKNGRAEYDKGHVSGAVFVDLDSELAAHDDGRAGRHPLPSAETFVAAMRRHGISGSTHVVAYDDAGGSVAARLWWLLRAHGHEAVSLLDGGFPLWVKEGRPVSTGPARVAPGNFTSHWNGAAAMDLAEMRGHLTKGAVVLDARARERYRGDTEPVDARPGHIPGAVSAPFVENLQDGRFLTPEKLRDRYQGVIPGQEEVIASCGSGVTACHHVFALDLSGVRPFPRARLYTGSYSEWARHRELPVATGDAPGEPS